MFTKFNPKMALSFFVFAVLAVSYSCKNSSSGGGGSGGISNEKLCVDSGGTWAGSFCNCRSGYDNSTSNPNICVRDDDEDKWAQARSNCRSDGYEWDERYNTCNRNASAYNADLRNYNAVECEDKRFYWNNDIISGQNKCQREPPTNQISCLKALHYWNYSTGRCQLRTAQEKQSLCVNNGQRVGATWYAERVECQCPRSGEIFDGNNCVPDNMLVNGFYNQNNGCSVSGGQWEQNNCNCNINPGYQTQQVQWNPYYNVCRSNNYQYQCPYLDGTTCRSGAGGAELIYNLVLGWATKEIIDSFWD